MMWRPIHIVSTDGAFGLSLSTGSWVAHQRIAPFLPGVPPAQVFAEVGTHAQKPTLVETPCTAHAASRAIVEG